MSQQIEAVAIEIHQINQEIKRLQELKEMKLESLADLMEQEGRSALRIPMPDKLFDLKVTYSPRKSKKVDKAQLALDLGVAESAINLPFLLRMVEQGRLTAQRYEDYVETLYNDSAQVRKVKAEPRSAKHYEQRKEQ